MISPALDTSSSGVIMLSSGQQVLKRSTPGPNEENGTQYFKGLATLLKKIAISA